MKIAFAPGGAQLFRDRHRGTSTAPTKTNALAMQSLKQRELVNVRYETCRVTKANQDSPPINLQRLNPTVHLSCEKCKTIPFWREVDFLASHLRRGARNFSELYTGGLRQRMHNGPNRSSSRISSAAFHILTKS